MAIHQQMHLPAVLRVAIIVVMAVCIVEAICSGVLHVHLPPSLTNGMGKFVKRPRGCADACKAGGPSEGLECPLSPW